MKTRTVCGNLLRLLPETRLLRTTPLMVKKPRNRKLPVMMPKRRMNRARSPQTGDATNVAAVAGIGGIAGLLAAAAALLRRRRSN